MNKFYSFLFAALFSISTMAETYTIVFNSNENGDGSATDKLEALVLTATNNCIDRVVSSAKVARAKPGYGIKGGTASEKGEIIFGLDDTYSVTSMTVDRKSVV